MSWLVGWLLGVGVGMVLVTPVLLFLVLRRVWRLGCWGWRLYQAGWYIPTR